MSKYFKLDKDKREIIIDKTKKYNVNVDILDLIIDLEQENAQLKEDKKKAIVFVNNNMYENYCYCGSEDRLLEILGDKGVEND